MSQKTSKRTRRHTEEELDASFKMPGASKTKEETPKTTSKDEPDSTASETNGFKGDSSPKVESTTNGENGGSQTDDSPKRVIQTRSRSNTPLIKTPENAKNDVNATESDDMSGAKNDDTDDDIKNPTVDEETNGVKADQTNDVKDETNGTEDETKNEPKNSSVLEEKVILNGGDEEDDSPIVLSLSHSPEMEPLVLEKDEEEAIPELQFDENDLDLESEGSPSRCKTRRSQTRNMSTPKTPKLIVEQEAESKTSYTALERLPDDSVSGKSTPKKLTSSNNSNVGSESQADEIADLDTSDTYSSVSTDNISTRAVAGSDATRNADFTYQDSGLFDENSLNSLTSPNRTLAETLRNLSPRRTIHAISGDYRKRAIQNSLEIKGDMYADYESVQRISAGLKRKNRSVTPEESKRFKKETPGLLSYISGPISNFKSSLSRTSTPKLIAYESRKGGFDDDDEDDDDIAKIRIENGNDDNREKKWCSIM